MTSIRAGESAVPTIGDHSGLPTDRIKRLRSEWGFHRRGREAAMSEQHEPANAQTERITRSARLLRATIQTACAGEQEMLIRNLSRKGLGGIVTTTPLSVDETAEVAIADIHVTGIVRWAKGKLFGLELLGEIDTDQIDATVRQALALATEGTWVPVPRPMAPAPKPSGLPRRRL